MIGNKNEELRFLCALREFTASGMTLVDSLRLIASSPNRRFMKNFSAMAAAYLIAQLENGSQFSNALLCCDAIKFDKAVVAFIAGTEQTGRLKETIDFLAKRAQKQKDMTGKLIGALIYPLFIVAVTVFGGVCFLFFGNEIASFAYSKSTLDYQSMALTGILRLAFFLVVAIFCCAFFVVKLFMCQCEYDVFSALNFLTSSYVHLSSALENAMVIAGASTTLGKKLVTVKMLLDTGTKPVVAFSGLFSKEIEAALYNSCQAGEEHKMFEAATSYIERRNENLWQQMTQLMEPFFIAVAGVCLFLIVSSTVLPLLSNIGVGF